MSYRQLLGCLLFLLFVGCATMSRKEAVSYCLDWANEQVQLGIYSHAVTAYTKCMHDAGHAGAVVNDRSHCGLSGLRCN